MLVKDSGRRWNIECRTLTATSFPQGRSAAGGNILYLAFRTEKQCSIG